MDTKLLKQTAEALVAEGKGILAADESVGTMTKRLDAIGVESTEETRRSYRDVLLTTQGMDQYISGVILFDETIRQKTDGGDSFPEILESMGVIPGIKVDKKAWPLPNFPNEKITEGLDGLRDQLVEYKELGAKFAKWRAVITIGEGIPTDTCINSNSEALARYAALCQEADIVPIVEPEVLMTGSHDMHRCEQVTYATLKSFFAKLHDHKIYLEGVLLKINMVLPGKESGEEVSDEEIANATCRVFKEVVPDEIPGIVFLSGGQSADEATTRLNEIAKVGKDLPWELSYSYGRALQAEALEAWGGKRENIESAKEVFLERAEKVSKARSGEL